MLTPNRIVIAARAVLLLGSIVAAILMLGPFQGMEQMFNLSDKTAHALAFGGLTAISFLAFPGMRRADLVRTALVMGAAVEVVQMFDAGRSASVADWAADAVGIMTVYGSSLIEGVRKMAREHGNVSFATLSKMDRRRSRKRAKVAFKPGQPAHGQRSTRFADRAAQRFPIRELG